MESGLIQLFLGYLCFAGENIFVSVAVGLVGIQDLLWQAVSCNPNNFMIKNIKL